MIKYQHSSKLQDFRRNKIKKFYIVVSQHKILGRKILMHTRVECTVLEQFSFQTGCRKFEVVQYTLPRFGLHNK